MGSGGREIATYNTTFILCIFSKYLKQLGSNELGLQAFTIMFVFGVTVTNEPGHPHSRGFLDHTRLNTVGRTPLDE